MLDTVSKPAVFHKYPSLKIISENIGLGSEELSLLTLSKMKEVWPHANAVILSGSDSGLPCQS